jgi:hypothetical protein
LENLKWCGSIEDRWVLKTGGGSIENEQPRMGGGIENGHWKSKNRWWVAGGSSRWLKTDHTSPLKPKYEEKVSKKKNYLGTHLELPCSCCHCCCWPGGAAGAAIAVSVVI